MRETGCKEKTKTHDDINCCMLQTCAYIYYETRGLPAAFLLHQVHWSMRAQSACCAEYVQTAGRMSTAWLMRIGTKVCHDGHCC